MSPGIVALLAALAALKVLWAAQSGTAPKTEPPEVAAQKSEPAFALRVEHNEVVVRVIDRDSQGRVVTNLGKDDFRFLDNNRPQVIAHFALETPAGEGAKTAAPTPARSTILT